VVEGPLVRQESLVVEGGSPTPRRYSRTFGDCVTVRSTRRRSTTTQDCRQVARQVREVREVPSLGRSFPVVDGLRARTHFFGSHAENLRNDLEERQVVSCALEDLDQNVLQVLDVDAVVPRGQLEAVYL